MPFVFFLLFYEDLLSLVLVSCGSEGSLTRDSATSELDTEYLPAAISALILSVFLIRSANHCNEREVRLLFLGIAVKFLLSSESVLMILPLGNFSL